MNALAWAAASTTSASNQPQRRFRPVVVPNSAPISRSRLAVGVQQLGRHRALAHPGRVGLGDPDDPVDPGRADPGPDAGAGGDRVGGGDVRVGAVVDVEVVRLGALEQHDLVPVQGVVEHPADVDDVRPDPLGVGEQVLGDLDRVERAPVVDLDQQVVLLLQRRLDLLPQDRLVEEVLDPDADPVDLVGVRRADPATGGADPGLAQEPLGDLVDHLVVGGDDVRVGGDEEPRGVDPAGRQPLDLVEEHVEVDHHAVADHRHAVRGSGSRRAAGAARTAHRRPRWCARRCCRRSSGRRSRPGPRAGRSPCPCPRRPTGRPPQQCPACDRRPLVTRSLARKARQGLLRALYEPQGLVRPNPERDCTRQFGVRRLAWSPAGTGRTAAPPRSSPIRPAATVSAQSARRKPRLGSCSHGIGPAPRQPDRRSASRPRW